MVRITSALAFLAMGASVMANPVAAEQNLVARADIGDKSSAVGAIADVVNKVVQLVQGMVNKDLERRRTFTQTTAKDVASQFPGHSVIVCNVGYSLSGSGDQLVYSTSYNAKVGSDVTFDVIVFKSPKTFDRRGDGGDDTSSGLTTLTAAATRTAATLSAFKRFAATFTEKTSG